MRISLITAVILAIVIIVFAVLDGQASGRVSDDQKSITTLRNQVTSLQNGLTTDESNIAVLGNQETADKGQIATLGTQVTAANAAVSALTTQLASDETKNASLGGQIPTLAQQVTAATAKITDLTNQNTNFSSQISTLQSQLTQATSQITALQTQISGLSSQVSSGTGSGQTALASGQAFSLNGGQQTLITSFNTSSNGTLYISGSSTTSTTGYVHVNNSQYGSSANYPFTNGSTITIPVQGGSNSLYYLDNDGAGTQATATLTASVSYTGIGTGTSQTILSSANITLIGQQQTTLATFNASVGGTLFVSGFVNTATAGYVFVVNSSYGTSSNYPFTSGGSVNIPIQPGSSTIYFKDNDPTGTTATGTFSATYN
jgi:hypothetical protein